MRRLKTVYTAQETAAHRTSTSPSLVLAELLRATADEDDHAGEGGQDATEDREAEAFPAEGEGDHEDPHGARGEQERRVARERRVETVDEADLKKHVAEEAEYHHGDPVLSERHETPPLRPQQNPHGESGAAKAQRVESQRLDFAQGGLYHGEVQPPDDRGQEEAEVDRQIVAAPAWTATCPSSPKVAFWIAYSRQSSWSKCHHSASYTVNPSASMTRRRSSRCQRCRDVPPG